MQANLWLNACVMLCSALQIDSNLLLIYLIKMYLLTFMKELVKIPHSMQAQLNQQSGLMEGS